MNDEISSLQNLGSSCSLTNLCISHSFSISASQKFVYPHIFQCYFSIISSFPSILPNFLFAYFLPSRFFFVRRSLAQWHSLSFQFMGERQGITVALPSPFLQCTKTSFSVRVFSTCILGHFAQSIHHQFGKFTQFQSRVNFPRNHFRSLFSRRICRNR